MLCARLAAVDEKALAELDEALAMLRGLGSRYRDRLETLQRDRDQLSRRAAEIQLAAVVSLPPDQSLLSLETLRLRVRKESALADLVEYWVPCDTRSRIETGWTFSVIDPSSMSCRMVSPSACSNWLQ